MGLRDRDLQSERLRAGEHPIGFPQRGVAVSNPAQAVRPRDQTFDRERLQSLRIRLLRHFGESTGEYACGLGLGGDDRLLGLNEESERRIGRLGGNLGGFLGKLRRPFQVARIEETIGLEPHRLRDEIRVLQFVRQLQSASSRGASASAVRPLRLRLFP